MSPTLGYQWKAAPVVIMVTLQACSTFQGAPSRAIEPAADLAALGEVMSPAAVLDCMKGIRDSVQLDEAARQACRNEIVTARKYAIDLQFSQFEQNFFSQNRWAGFAANVTALGLGIAGGLSPSGPAQALAAAAAGLTGARTAYEREVLAERTLLTIDTSMHAQRDLIAVNIRDGLQKSVGDYPLGAALSDLDAYYEAGTLLGGLSTVTQLAGAQAATAQDALRNPLPVTRTPAALFLRNLVHAGTEAEQSSNEARIRAEMTKQGVPANVSVPRFALTGDPGQVAAVAGALGWTP